MGYKVRIGTWDTGDMTDAYLIRALPLAPDQPADKPWTDPVPDGSFYRPFARLLTSGDAQRHPDGYGSGQWTFGYWTWGMFGYWLNDLFGGAYSVAATIETRRMDTGAFDVFHVTLQLPDPRRADTRARRVPRRPDGHRPGHGGAVISGGLAGLQRICRRLWSHLRALWGRLRRGGDAEDRSYEDNVYWRRD
ncbi:MAG: hypothetical protein M5R40_06620 [Anaerolineae bacterium]|nr:hypothetical protein [Anaerolineae bacterium]